LQESQLTWDHDDLWDKKNDQKWVPSEKKTQVIAITRAYSWD
jgi:hypothetical protein